MILAQQSLLISDSRCFISSFELTDFDKTKLLQSHTMQLHIVRLPFHLQDEQMTDQLLIDCNSTVHSCYFIAATLLKHSESTLPSR